VAIAIERAEFLSEREAAELTRQKADLASTLLASLSHDMRTPLTAIRVAVENLGGPLGADERRAQASAAAMELDRLTRLVRDILDMARIDAAAITIERQWVSAADVVDAAIAHARLAVEGRALHVDADPCRQVQVDPRLVSSALSHLLENAAQYAPADQAIHVRATIEADGLHVVVTDHGPGLEAGEIDHLFERFYRGRAARETTSGTGMGLAITRGLLVAAGGRVWAENVRTGGARFSVVVPAAVRTMPITEVT
jgi:two-component system sensor histidine kinase KdpD